MSGVDDKTAKNIEQREQAARRSRDAGKGARYTGRGSRDAGRGPPNVRRGGKTGEGKPKYSYPTGSPFPNEIVDTGTHF